MRFALVDGHRAEPNPGGRGACPCCGAEMLAKCGDVYAYHWSHKARRMCDPWWENETAWHRGWKEQFPLEWQERIHHSDAGEKHIADVKTDAGWVLEFQHSYLKPAERQARSDFYLKLMWVVDASRRVRDVDQMISAIKAGNGIGHHGVVRVNLAEATLLREWGYCGSDVLFDLGPEFLLLWLTPEPTGEAAYLKTMPRETFVDLHLNGASDSADPFAELSLSFRKAAVHWETELRRPAQPGQQTQLAQGALRQRERTVRSRRSQSKRNRRL